MSAFTRRKRVTGPLDDKVKARIFGRDRFEPGYVSSGSEYSAQVDDDDVVSPSLSDLLNDFLVDDDALAAAAAAASELKENDSDAERESSMYYFADAIDELNRILRQNVDSYRNVLEASVSKAVENFSCVKMNKSIFRRNVMAFLRESGYNAAVCKTKWESSGGLTAGNYEFIDVVRSDSTRYFIGVDFAAEFEIARPTSSYERLLHSLPRVFVGRAEQLKQVLRIMSDAARRSLKSRGLHLPPWRKHRFMQNKWFGTYRRTATIFPASFSATTSPSKQTFVVKCRSVGFDANTVNGLLFFPATTRTR